MKNNGKTFSPEDNRVVPADGADKSEMVEAIFLIASRQTFDNALRVVINYRSVRWKPKIEAHDGSRFNFIASKRSKQSARLLTQSFSWVSHQRNEEKFSNWNLRIHNRCKSSKEFFFLVCIKGKKLFFKFESKLLLPLAFKQAGKARWER